MQNTHDATQHNTTQKRPPIIQTIIDHCPRLRSRGALSGCHWSPSTQMPGSDEASRCSVTVLLSDEEWALYSAEKRPKGLFAPRVPFVSHSCPICVPFVSHLCPIRVPFVSHSCPICVPFVSHSSPIRVLNILALLSTCVYAQHITHLSTHTMYIL